MNAHAGEGVAKFFAGQFDKLTHALVCLAWPRDRIECGLAKKLVARVRHLVAQIMLLLTCGVLGRPAVPR